MIWPEEWFAKALRNFEPFVLVNNNLCGKLLSSLESPTVFDESFKVTLVPSFSPDFNLLSWEKCFRCEKSKIVSFASSVMKTFV